MSNYFIRCNKACIEKTAVAISYTNWRGETADRTIIPIGIRFGNNEWHKQDQWLLKALDVDKGTAREFAMAGIHSWRPISEKREDQ